MKNFTIFALVFTVLFASAGYAFADSVTFTPDQCPSVSNHRVFAQDDSTITGCISNSIWDAQVTAAQLQNGVSLPGVASGASVTDDHGITYTCSEDWSCVDTIHTDAYRAQMMAIATALKGLVLSTHRFDGWIAMVK